MSQPLSSLSDADVRQILQLVESLDRSTFDYLQIESGVLKVTIGKGMLPAAAPLAAPSAAAPALVAPAAVPAVAVAAPTAPAVVPARAVPAPASLAPEGTVAIEAPMMGRFYARPEPGAAPFVTVGATVTPETTVALIEVMKVFTAVQAGVAGVITGICVQDSEFIEFKQVLFRVQPA